MIVTFYSYKGGVGRSMAMANVAQWLQSQGLRVVIVDWDLEAPGLEAFFGAGAKEKEALRGKMGLLELLTGYRDIFTSLPGIPAEDSGAAELPTEAGEAPSAAAKGNRLEQMVELLNQVLPPLSHVLVTLREDSSGGSLRLLTAGARVGDRFNRYAETVQGFDWSEFYAQFEGEAYFEWMRRQLTDPALADIVLIDSRTGVAEMSGVCTRQLADIVVCLCAPNDQNLDGVEMMAQSFQRPDLVDARGGRPIQLVMVPARVDLSEGRPVDIFEERFKQKLKQFAPRLFVQLGVFYDKLRIPYIKEYAYSEHLAIGDPRGVKSIQEAYITLGAHIAALAPGDSAVRRQCRDTLQKAFGLPTVYFSYLSDGEEKCAQSLSRRLEGAGAITVVARGAVLPAQPANAAVLVVGKQTLMDAQAAAGWWAAREKGLCLYFVAAGISPGDVERPRWARKARVYDGVSDWEEFATAVQSPCQARRNPLMAPPLSAPVVGRDNEIQRIKELLLQPGANAFTDFPPIESGSRPQMIALLGPPGAGKTALAQAVCRDDDVIDEFEGGIMWASLSDSHTETASALNAMLNALGETDRIDSIEEVTRRLADAISGRRCLVVLDDVSDIAQLGSLRNLERGSRLLVTSRFRNVASETGARTVEVGVLDNEAACALLLDGIEPKSVPEAKATELAGLLGNVPIALQVANRMIRARRLEYSEVPVQVIDGLIESIRRDGLESLDLESSAVYGSTLFSAYSMALERLDSEDRARLPRLANLPGNRDLRMEEVASALELGVSQTERLTRRLASMSLVEISGSGSVRIPVISSGYFQSLAKQQRRAEAARERTVVSKGARIFVSYIRADTGSYARLLYDRLSVFGLDRVFLDTEILPGQDWTEAILRQVSAATVAVALIGPKWAEHIKGSDFVRQELRFLLEKGVPVIPVLVEHARMPSAGELPSGLEPLARRAALEINPAEFQQGMDRLIEAIRHLEPLESPVPVHLEGVWARAAAALRSRWAVLGVMILVLAGIWMVYQWKAGTPTGSVVLTPVLVREQSSFDQAERYYYGRGVPQDFEKAAALYRESASQGFAPAMNSLGRLYELGQGVPKDLAQAKAWYQKAAALKNPDAQAALNTLGTWTVLIATDETIDYAKRWAASARRAGLGAATVYVVGGKYLTTVGHYATREQAEAALAGIRPKTRGDANAIDLTKWCPSSTARIEAGLQVSVCSKPR